MALLTIRNLTVRFATSTGTFTAVNGVDVTGSNIAAKTRRLVGRDVSDAAWFTTATASNFTAGTTIVEDVHDDPLTTAVWGARSAQAHSMSFTYPIRNANGETVGVWSNRVNLDILDPVIEKVRAGFQEQGEDVNLTIVNREGSVLATTIGELARFSTPVTPWRSPRPTSSSIASTRSRRSSADQSGRCRARPSPTI